MRRRTRNVLLILVPLPAILAGCGPDYSPNTYATSAVQQANKVEQGTVVGARRVDVSSGGAVGAATGAAAGGVLGSTAPGGNVGSAFGAVGGALVGGLIGTAAEHTTADTFAYEYIVRKANNEMVSVTQRDPVPLAVGEKVLVIAGNQARIVPDYTTTSTARDATKDKDAEKANAGNGTAPAPGPVTATVLAPPPAAASDRPAAPASGNGAVPLTPPPSMLRQVEPPAPIAAPGNP